MKWSCKGHEFTIGGEALIMGVLNVTPDSFSDGGKHTSVKAAVSHGLRMIDEGAVIVDVGGESTRPGAVDVPLDEELHRTIPVVRALAQETGVAISIDTRKAKVARKAILAGASIINDVSALSHDPSMADFARDAGAGIVLMHMRDRPRTMQDNPVYEEVVNDVMSYLDQRICAATEAGVSEDAIAVDPGIGFGKTVEHNLALLAGIPALASLGRPVLVGLSRKSFLGRLTDRTTDDRLAAGIAAHTYAILRGAHILRVHDIRETRDAVTVVHALMKQVG